jgi:hypothetical protein
MKKRTFLCRVLAALIVPTGLPLVAQAQAKPVIDVWKTPTCGCCHDWMAHLQANGFEVIGHDVSEGIKAEKRKSLGLPEQLGSCHTALVKGYAIEGHVPASDIKRLLKERPKAVGLAVPGMPIGSPGMDGPAYGGRKDKFDTLLVQAGGVTAVYQAH